tara:strand:+ start:540 stop:770 length:231 start_codon:yes stop_codon:yes gene_type:complete
MARHITEGQTIYIIFMDGEPILESGICLDSTTAEIVKGEICPDTAIDAGRVQVRSFNAFTYRPLRWGEDDIPFTSG